PSLRVMALPFPASALAFRQCRTMFLPSPARHSYSVIIWLFARLAYRGRIRLSMAAVIGYRAEPLPRRRAKLRSALAAPPRHRWILQWHRRCGSALPFRWLLRSFQDFMLGVH